MENKEEVFVDIAGYEGLYQVSNFGRVKSVKRVLKWGSVSYLTKEIILKPLVYRGYYHVNLRRDGGYHSKKIHQLVAVAFLGHNPCGCVLVVNHINGNGFINKVENLEIVTTRENSSVCFRKDKDTQSSKYVGICWHGKEGKWLSRIQINRERIHLGYFNSEIEASAAYQNALSKI